jgi:hypothetical protein
MSCAKKKFIALDYVGDFHGIGSELHCYATYFYWGFVQDRIVTYNATKGFVWTSGKYCGGNNSYDCFFLPITNCTIGPDSDVVSSKSYYRWTRRFPDWAGEILNKSVIHPAAYCWYWKAMVIQYLCRMNPRMLQSLTQFIREAGLPFKSYEETHFDISIHVRGGDKQKEAKPAPARYYIRTVDTIRKMLGRRVSVFLCTDQQHVVEEMRRAEGIDLYVLNDPHRDYNSWLLLRRFGDRVGLYTVADVMCAVKSDYLLGTWSSNFERLITELRSTTFKLASKPFVEVGRASCISTAHCELLGKHFNYWYRGEWL